MLRRRLSAFQILTGITLSEAQIRRTLHKLGLKYRKTGVIPCKANPQLQFDFATPELTPKLIDSIRLAHPDKVVSLVDNAR